MTWAKTGLPKYMAKRFQVVKEEFDDAVRAGPIQVENGRNSDYRRAINCLQRSHPKTLGQQWDKINCAGKRNRTFDLLITIPKTHTFRRSHNPLSPAAASTSFSATCAYRSVMPTWLCPRSLATTGSGTPLSTACEATL